MQGQLVDINTFKTGSVNFIKKSIGAVHKVVLTSGKYCSECDQL